MSSRWTWRLVALPGVAWLSVFFLVAFYAVVSVALGNRDTLSQPVPFWNPLDWNVGYLGSVLSNIWHGGQFLTVFVRTVAFVALAFGLSLLIGYPVAYFAARHAGKWRGLVLLGLILPFWLNYLMRMLAWINLLSPDGGGTRVLRALTLPFWINYLMRMLAWINLLSPDGWGTRVLHDMGIERVFLALGLLSSRGGWLEGQSTTVVLALVYGYIPFLILPLYAALHRIA